VFLLTWSYDLISVKEERKAGFSPTRIKFRPFIIDGSALVCGRDAIISKVRLIGSIRIP